MNLSIRGKPKEGHSPSTRSVKGIPSRTFYLLYLMATIPAWALLTYPGWFELRAGYFPYFNLNAWLQSPTLIWYPPYAVPPRVPQIPIVEGGAALLQRIGWAPLPALRLMGILSLLTGSALALRYTRPRASAWTAWATGLLWLYAPPTLYALYRGGFWGTVWAGAGLLAVMSLLPRFGHRRLLYAGEIGGLLLVWGIRLIPLPPRWEIWSGLVLLTALTLPAVIHLLRALGHPLAALLIVAWAAVWTLPWVQPHYLAYEPPPRPTAFYPRTELLLLDVQVGGRLEPGHTLHLLAHWQSLRPQEHPWTVFVQVLDRENHIWGQVDLPLGGRARPVTRWRIGEVVAQSYTLRVSPQAPRTLRLIMGVYDLTTMRRLQTRDGHDHVVIAKTHP